MLHTKGALDLDQILSWCKRLPPCQLDSVSLSRSNAAYMGRVQSCRLVRMEMLIELPLHSWGLIFRAQELKC